MTVKFGVFGMDGDQPYVEDVEIDLDVYGRDVREAFDLFAKDGLEDIEIVGITRKNITHGSFRGH